MIKNSLIFFLLLTPFAMFGQTINSTLDANEYGTSNSYNYGGGTGSPTSTWFMTWDATYLYIYLGDANETEAAIIYFDFDSNKNPITGNGSAVGVTHHGMTPDLPFNADAAIYCTNSFRRIDTSSSGGTWSAVHTGGSLGFTGGSTGTDYSNGFYSSHDNGNGAGTDDRREFKIRWDDLTKTSGKPDTFLFMAMLNTATYIYGEVPVDNPGGAQGATPDVEWYFQTNSSASTPASTPFTNASFTMRDATVAAFGGIATHHFTMARNADTITRSSGSTWSITGDLCIANGAISMGNTAYADSCNVAGDVEIDAGGTLILSASTGNLYIKGDFKNNGDFIPNGSIVEFQGAGDQYIRGNNWNDNSDTINHFNRLEIDKPSGKLILGTDSVRIKYNSTHSSGELTFTQGKIYLDTSELILGTGVMIAGAGASMFVVTDSTGSLHKDFSAAGSFIYPLGTTDGATAEYSPITLNFTSMSAALSAGVRAVDSIHPNLMGTPTSYIDRFWRVGNTGAATFSCNVSVVYVTADIHGTESSMFCGKYDGTWLLGSAVSAPNNLLNYTAATSFSDFTGAEASALPIDLIAFRGVRLDDRRVQLSWDVASEENVSYYSVYKSTEASAMVYIGQINAEGNISELKTYGFIDESALATEITYYLEAVDMDNSSELFDPILILKRNQSVPKITYIDNRNIRIDGLDAIGGQKASFHVINTLGVDVTADVIIDEKGRSSYLSLDSLVVGYYTLLVSSKSNSVSHKFIVFH